MKDVMQKMGVELFGKAVVEVVRFDADLKFKVEDTKIEYDVKSGKEGENAMANIKFIVLAPNKMGFFTQKSIPLDEIVKAVKNDDFDFSMNLVKVIVADLNKEYDKFLAGFNKE